VQQLKEKSLSRINTPTRFLGLKALEILLLGSLLCCGIFSYWLLFATLPLVIFVIKKLHTAHKNGCPDFLSEFLNQLNTKSEFIDKNNIMSKL